MRNVAPPKISILLLNYNGLDYLKQTIQPITELEFPDKEIVVFDNGSTDNSVQFLQTFKQIRIVENGYNSGYSKGKNSGVAATAGDFVLMLDNDILIHDKTILKKLIANYSEETGFLQVPLFDVNCSLTNYYGVFYSLYGVNLHRKPFSKTNFEESKHALIEIPGATGGCMFFKRKVWDTLGGFDESQEFNIDDIDLAARSMLMGYKNFIYTRSFFTHLGVNKTATAENFAKRFRTAFSGHARCFLKNLKFRNLIIVFPAFCLFMFLKSIRYAVKFRSCKIIGAFIFSVFFFLKNLKQTLSERKKIQTNRKIKNDDFLKIKKLTI